MNWQKLPFVRLLLPFSVGIWMSDRVPAAALLPAAALAVGVVLISQGKPLGFRRRLLSGPGFLLATALLGIYIGRQAGGQWDPRHISYHADRLDCLSGRVAGGTGGRLLLDLLAGRRHSGEWQPVSGRLLAQIPAEVATRPGDTLIIAARPERIAGPRNPEAFNYARYMANRGVFWRLYGREGAYAVLPQAGEGIRWWSPHGIRSYCLSVLRRRLTDPDAFGVGAALILGYRAALDETVREAYSASGAMHVLAVSGLHVGMVYLAIGWLMHLVPGTGRMLRLLKAGLQLGTVWCYVWLTGMPPSAVRAGTMLSFFQFGKALELQVNGYNTLAASAFCMLLVNPHLLFDVGFQLSYAAVTAIIAWQPAIYRLRYFGNRGLDYLWRLLSLSLAAQMGTFALSLYYFSQFPLYFWLSAFFAVPAAGFILGGGLALISLDGVAWVGDALGIFLATLLKWVNTGLFWIGDLPGSQLTGLWVDEVTVWGYYVGLIILGADVRVRRASRLLFVVALIALWSFWRAGHQLHVYRQRQVVIYAVTGHTLIDLFDGHRHVALHDRSLTGAVEAWAAGPYRRSRGVRTLAGIPLDSVGQGAAWRYRSGLLQFYAKRLLILDRSACLECLPAMEAAAVLLCDNPEVSVAALCERVESPLVILDASNSSRNIARWRAECRRRGQPCHDIRRDGALILDWTE